MMENKSGLPDVAEKESRNKPVLMLIFGAVIIVILAMFFSSRMHAGKNTQIQMEETYTVKSKPVVEHATAIPVTPVSPEVIQQQVALIQEKQKELQLRLAAPLMLVNASQTSNSADISQQAKMESSDANTQFMQQVSAKNSETATVSSIGALNSVIAEGSMIHAILESATNSDLPGMLRASVSEPVYSEDGSQILIPPGSRLIGQYKSGIAQGQSRIFIVWTRLITPKGFSIQLGSPGVDSLGVAGMGADEINRHFWQRFGSASLLSLIGAGVANTNDHGDTASSYREAVAKSFSQSASQSLQQDNRISPTLSTYQGKPIIVFVAKDLHFDNAIKSVKNKFNVF